MISALGMSPGNPGSNLSPALHIGQFLTSFGTVLNHWYLGLYTKLLISPVSVSAADERPLCGYRDDVQQGELQGAGVGVIWSLPIVGQTYSVPFDSSLSPVACQLVKRIWLMSFSVSVAK
jgi:hypothetical protein